MEQKCTLRAAETFMTTARGMWLKQMLGWKMMSLAQDRNLKLDTWASPQNEAECEPQVRSCIDLPSFSEPTSGSGWSLG